MESEKKMRCRFEWWVRKLMFFPMVGIAYYLYWTKVRAKKIILKEVEEEMRWIDKVKGLLKRDEAIQKDMDLEKEEAEEVIQDGERKEGDDQRVAV